MGQRDAVVPVQQSIEFAARLRTAFGNAWSPSSCSKGAEHADPRFEAPQNVDRGVGFLDEHLKSA